MDAAEQVRKAVEELANTPMSMPLERWGELSNVLLSAAEKLAALEARVVDLECDLEMLEHSGGYGV